MRRYLPVALVLSLSLGTTGLLWRHEQRAAENNLRTQFDYSLRETTARIVQRMNAYEQMLRGLQGFYAGSTEISRSDFTAYANSLQLGADFAGVVGIGLIPLTPAKNKAALIAELHAQGIANYAIKPIGERDIYAPIIQIEPFTGRNIPALGYDPYSDPVRRAAMDDARDAGAMRISNKVKEVPGQRPDEGPTFIMYAPLYRQGAATNTTANRRASLTGWVYAPIRLTELMASLYGDTNLDIAVSIHDGIVPEPASLLFSTLPESANNSQRHASEYLEVGGRSWRIEAYALPGFEERFGRSDARTIAISGLCLSLLLALLTWILATGRQLAQRLAHNMTEELRSSEERWKFALEGAGDGVWDHNLTTDEIFYSRRCLEIFGYRPDEIRPQRSEWTQRIHPDDSPAAVAATDACLTGEQTSFSNEFRLQCKNGDWKWVLVRGRVVSRSPDGKPLRLIGTVTDIDARKAIEERIRHMAQHDPLTNLPNRALFADRLHQALSTARRDHTHLALFFVDLDKFKSVNDSFGHAAGDLLLQEAARRMQACVRESDTVGRIGGDEFVILLPVLSSLEDARYIADNIRHSLAEPFEIDTHHLRISASLGIACHPEHGNTQTMLWAAADAAMYAAKDAGGNQVRISAEAAPIGHLQTKTPENG